MILLGKVFILFIYLFIEILKFLRTIKFYSISQVVVLNDIVSQAFFSMEKKLYCFSQVLVLNDIVRKAFYFLDTGNSTLSLRFWC